VQAIFGSNLATTTAMATTTPLPLTLGGVTVTIGSTSVPLLYVSCTQIKLQVPTELITGQVVVTVAPSCSICQPDTPYRVHLGAIPVGIFKVATLAQFFLDF
jgi:uncharacterized protein (TIGR03437 family)